MFTMLLQCLILACGSIYATVTISQTSTVEGHADTSIVSPGLTRYLQTIGEPALAHAAKERTAHAYRLIWRAFPSGTGVVVRLSIDMDGTAAVVSKVTEGGNEGRVVLDKTDKIAAEDVYQFLEVVKRDDFWSVTSYEIQEPPLAKDGATWIVEGVRGGAYHAVYRRNPKPSRYTEIGRYLAKKLARLGDDTFSVPEYHF